MLSVARTQGNACRGIYTAPGKFTCRYRNVIRNTLAMSANTQLAEIEQQLREQALAPQLTVVPYRHHKVCVCVGGLSVVR